MTNCEIRYGVYRSEKQSDGTYNIYFYVHGNKKEIVKDGVRGCNVQRMIVKLESELFQKWLDRL